MNIEVLEIRKMDRTADYMGKVKGFADIQLGEIRINDFKLITGSNSRDWVSVNI